MTISRIPVIGSHLPPPLPCQGQCPQFQAAEATVVPGEHFRCHAGGPGACTAPDGQRYISFLYPRKRRENGSIHTHEGVDLPGADGVSRIIAVAAGTVRFASNEWQRGFGGYGRVVVIQANPHPSNGVVYWYLYAHCNHVEVQVGDVVAEQQFLATVGDTLYDTPGDVGHAPGPHLHFEVSNSPYPKNPNFERTGWSPSPTSADTAHGWREDPFEHLEMLGPWGAQKVYFPIVGDGSGELADHSVEQSRSEALFRQTEQEETSGGFFPLGANNFWHGGVHLHASEGARVRAPLAGRIVAARLDPDAVRAHQDFGSVNFILIKHELPAAIARALENDGHGAASQPTARESVGRYVGRPPRRSRPPTNPPSRVTEIRRDLERLGFYHPATPPTPSTGSDGTLDDALVDAIVAFQTSIDRTPDGVIAIPGPTYRQLGLRIRALDREHPPAAEAAATPAPSEPLKVVYSLLMHLKAEAFTDTLARRIPWLATARLEEEEQDAAPAPADETSLYSMTGGVGTGMPNAAADVVWVQQRLVYHHAMEGAPTGTWTPELDEAIKAFQRAHVGYYRTRAPDGQITPDHATQHTLAAPHEMVDRVAGGRESASIPARVRSRLEEVDDTTGVAKVVTGFDVRIAAGDVLWTMGSGRAFSERASTDETPHESECLPFVHWEVFSADKLIGTWDVIESDVDDDLTMDVPGLVDYVEGNAPPAEGAQTETAAPRVLTAAEIRTFYANARSRNLRETQFKFCSEWGVNADHAVQSLTDLGFHTIGLADSLAPYLWWTAAGDVVPSAPVVWHYNPVSFMQRYADELDPPSTTSAVAGPTTTSSSTSP